jgi:hypothetical protein
MRVFGGSTRGGGGEEARERIFVQFAAEEEGGLGVEPETSATQLLLRSCFMGGRGVQPRGECIPIHSLG